jgi:uncharacterized protein
MTPDEQKMLEDLADKFQNTPSPPKDPEAEEFIRKRIGSRPDALYLMTQTVLIQNLALQQAQQQLRELQQRSGQPAQVASTGSFLGGQQAPPRYSRSGYSGQQQSASPPQYAPPPPQYAPMPSPGSGAPSFLKGAAQTAAGVAAGALAFEGIQALFSHPGYGGGPGFFGGGGFGGGYGGAPVEETVVNNYYDDDRGRDDYRADDQGNYDTQNVDDSGQYDNSANYDDSGNFDSGDGGGFDDGGGGDNFV